MRVIHYIAGCMLYLAGYGIFRVLIWMQLHRKVFHITYSFYHQVWSYVFGTKITDSLTHLNSRKFEKMKGMKDIVRNLPLFTLLEESFISEIKMTAYTDQKMLIVTQSDEVYGLGTLPDAKNYIDEFILRPIPQLHKKYVERFVIGENFVLILTKWGEIFGWGGNEYGQLGFGREDYVHEPTIIPSFEGKKVTDISCASSHVVALCSDQQLYRWGEICVKYGQWSLVPKYTANDVIGIATSATASFYLTSDGKVEGVGYVYKKTNSSDCSLGNGYVSSIDCEWTKIENLSNIKKIAAGKHHVIALNNDGIVFVWGSNEKKQLSHCIPSEFQATPIQLSCFSEKIMDIAANSQSDMSVAVTKSSKMYVWGGCSGGCISKPFLVNFTSLEEVFTYYSYPSMTYRGVTFQDVKKDKVIESGTLESIFDEQEDSDLIITVEEKDIHVHKVILKARSKYFRAMFTNQWKESNKKVLKIDGHSYDSFRSFLLYLYTGEIEITTENIFELVAIADKYADEALSELIEKELNSSSIPDEIVEALKCVMKLSPSNAVKFVDGLRKMTVPSS